MLPECRDQDEPWFTLWSALAHQGDVYPASFAAVPYVVKALATDPARAGADYFHFPAWVEINRHRNGITIPQDLQPAYESALRQLPSLVAVAAARDWDSVLLRSALSAIAASKGHIDLAEAILELDSEVAREFMAWFQDR
jgi:hypothetical protein